MNENIRIDRLDLDLRGVDPATAEATVRLLGPALRAQFAQQRSPVKASTYVDAGRVAPVSEPAVLASRIAQRIVQRTQES